MIGALRRSWFRQQGDVLVVNSVQDFPHVMQYRLDRWRS
jgi:hypothetical protein